MKWVLSPGNESNAIALWKISGEQPFIIAELVFDVFTKQDRLDIAWAVISVIERVKEEQQEQQQSDADFYQPLGR